MRMASRPKELFQILRFQNQTRYRAAGIEDESVAILQWFATGACDLAIYTQLGKIS